MATHTQRPHSSPAAILAEEAVQQQCSTGPATAQQQPVSAAAQDYKVCISYFWRQREGRERERQGEPKREREQEGRREGGKEDAAMETSKGDMIYTTSIFNCTYCH